MKVIINLTIKKNGMMKNLKRKMNKLLLNKENNKLIKLQNNFLDWKNKKGL